MTPLAERMRPKVLEDFVGQKHIIGKGMPLYNMIQKKQIPNCILYGPPGTGKTTLANIMASYVDKKFYKLNATTDSIKEIQEIASTLDTFLGYNGVVLYIDEFQLYSKRQQQILLGFIESGKITLIASTTENPYFAFHKAVLSRCNIFQFKALSREDIVVGLKEAINRAVESGLKIEYEKEALDYIADISQGDYRKAYNILECAVNSNLSNIIKITAKYIESLGQSNMKSDASGDDYYNYLSALQKSIRGSDPDASIHYLARLIKGGNLTAIVRRISVIAAEDIGLAYPNALNVVNSGIELALKTGLPEARIILAELVIYLATLPKSNSAYIAIDRALNDIETRSVGDVPNHLKDAHYAGASKLGVGGYKYPHDFENDYVKQQYLPDSLKGTVYYEAKNNKYEESLRKYWEMVKKNRK